MACQITIYTTQSFSLRVKYLYCPKCKELRVKPWYSIRDRCARCYGDTKVIPIPPSVFTYVVYVTMGICFVLLYLYSRNNEDTYFYVAIAFAVVMAASQIKELIRGERYARARIKVTRSDVDTMKKKTRRR